MEGPSYRAVHTSGMRRRAVPLAGQLGGCLTSVKLTGASSDVSSHPLSTNIPSLILCHRLKSIATAILIAPPRESCTALATHWPSFVLFANSSRCQTFQMNSFIRSFHTFIFPKRCMWMTNMRRDRRLCATSR